MRINVIGKMFIRCPYCGDWYGIMERVGGGHYWIHEGTNSSRCSHNTGWNFNSTTIYFTQR